jgi:hypothetical protein
MMENQKWILIILSLVIFSNYAYAGLFSPLYPPGVTSGAVCGILGCTMKGNINMNWSYITNAYLANVTMYDTTFIGNNTIQQMYDAANNGSFVPYIGADKNIYLGRHNITINGSIMFEERTGIHNLFTVNPVNGDGFSMQYWYDFELANDDWLVFKKTDGNDNVPDGGIAFMMSNASGHNQTVMKIDGYGNANFTNYDISTTGKLDVGKTTTIHSNMTVDHKITTKSLNVTNNIYSEGNLIITGNMSVKRPYGMWSSTETQTVPIANTKYTFNYTNTEDSYLINLQTDKRHFQVEQTGDYLIILSIMAQSETISKRAYVWVEKNDIDVPRSTTLYDFKSAGGQAVIAVPFILDLNTTDTFSVNYAGSDNAISFPYTANTSFCPETPSIIITMTKI